MKSSIRVMIELFLQMLAIFLVIGGTWYFFFSRERIISNFNSDPLFSFFGAAIIQWFVSQLYLFQAVTNLKKSGYEIKIWELIPSLIVAEAAFIYLVYYFLYLTGILILIWPILNLTK